MLSAQQQIALCADVQGWGGFGSARPTVMIGAYWACSESEVHSLELPTCGKVNNLGSGTMESGECASGVCSTDLKH